MFCLHCGKEIPQDSTFCMACGKPIAPNQQRSVPWLLIAGVVGAAFLIGVGLTIGLKTLGEKRLNPTPAAETTQAAPVIRPDRPGALLQSSPSHVEPTLTPAEISSKFAPSVVTIYKRGENGMRSGQGSGFLLNRDTVLTNYHVIRGASGAQVATVSGDTIEVDSIVAFNVERDIAAIRIPSLDLPPYVPELSMGGGRNAVASY